jgi:hypothetical protein
LLLPLLPGLLLLPAGNVSDQSTAWFSWDSITAVYCVRCIVCTQKLYSKTVLKKIVFEYCCVYSKTAFLRWCDSWDSINLSGGVLCIVCTQKPRF